MQNEQATLEMVPTLFLRNGRRLLQVTAQQASDAMSALHKASVAKYGETRNIRNIPLHDIDGKQIGYVSYNGRVWLGGPSHDNSSVEIPLKGVKTAAQHEAEGWKDCR